MAQQRLTMALMETHQVSLDACPGAVGLIMTPWRLTAAPWKHSKAPRRLTMVL
jgi:hypothetical protein